MKIGTRVKVVGLPDDAIVQPFLAPFLGKIGTVQTSPDISGGQWVDFDGRGGVFEARELEAL
jgi:hypothetical protein